MTVAATTPTRLILPHWFDAHMHARQGVVVARLLTDHAAMGCDAILAMPNTNPPVAKVHDADPGDWRSAEDYQRELRAAAGENIRHILTPLYITPDTNAKMVRAHAATGGRSLKYYPPHGTTNAEHGLGINRLIGGDMLRAMEGEGLILNIHGERHGLTGEAYFGRDGNAESRFYGQEMARLIARHPRLRIVCEHISTAAAVEFVQQQGRNVAATVTPQHLLLTVGGMVQNWQAHVKCMPLVKFEEDRQALLDAITKPGQTKFLAGTDSAPHAAVLKEASVCGAGCFTALSALELYAEAFEAAGALDKLEGFASHHGPDFYGLPRNAGTVTLRREPYVLPESVPFGEAAVLKPLRGGETLAWRQA